MSNGRSCSLFKGPRRIFTDSAASTGRYRSFIKISVPSATHPGANCAVEFLIIGWTRFRCLLAYDFSDGALRGCDLPSWQSCSEALYHVLLNLVSSQRRNGDSKILVRPWESNACNHSDQRYSTGTHPVLSAEKYKDPGLDAGWVRFRRTRSRRRIRSYLRSHGQSTIRIRKPSAQGMSRNHGD